MLAPIYNITSYGRQSLNCLHSIPVNGYNSVLTSQEEFKGQAFQKSKTEDRLILEHKPLAGAYKLVFHESNVSIDFQASAIGLAFIDLKTLSQLHIKPTKASIFSILNPTKPLAEIAFDWSGAYYKWRSLDVHFYAYAQTDLTIHAAEGKLITIPAGTVFMTNKREEFFIEHKKLGEQLVSGQILPLDVYSKPILFDNAAPIYASILEKKEKGILPAGVVIHPQNALVSEDKSFAYIRQSSYEGWIKLLEN
jgi:hypothetical protein